MTKWLRVLEFRGIQATPTESDADVLPLLSGWGANAWNGVAMYSRYALPAPCQDLVKLNIYGCLSGSRSPTQPVLGCAFCWGPVPTDPGLLTELRARQQFLLEIMHQAAVLAAPVYNLDVAPFVAARQRVIDEDFRHEFWIGKPVSSPDRKRKARIFFRHEDQPLTYLVLEDSKGNELRRFLFAQADEALLGKLTWVSNDTVQILQANKRDYWLCGVDGSVEFRFPQADSREPHAQYRLATILLGGHGVLPDRVQARELLQQAADQGYKHAIKRLSSLTDDEAADVAQPPGIRPPGNW